MSRKKIASKAAHFPTWEMDGNCLVNHISFMFGESLLFPYCLMFLSHTKNVSQNGRIEI